MIEMAADYHPAEKPRLTSAQLLGAGTGLVLGIALAIIVALVFGLALTLALVVGLGFTLALGALGWILGTQLARLPAVR